MKTATLAVALLIVAPAALLLVRADDKKPAKSAVKKQTSSDMLPDEQPLGMNVKLTFTVTNDDGRHSFSVVCAGRSFLSERDIVEADGGHQLKFAGYIKAVDAKDRVFVYFDALRYHSNDTEGVNATFKLKGSAIVTLGKPTDAGSLGDEKVTLTATRVE